MTQLKIHILSQPFKRANRFQEIEIYINCLKKLEHFPLILSHYMKHVFELETPCMRSGTQRMSAVGNLAQASIACSFGVLHVLSLLTLAGHTTAWKVEQSSARSTGS